MISLQVNGKLVGTAHADSGDSNDLEIASLHSTLALIKGDQVALWLGGGELHEHSDRRHYNHFTGWLDEEDLHL